MEMSRDYLGYHICENDTLVYTETPVGFIKNDTIYAYVKENKQWLYYSVNGDDNYHK